MAKAEISWKRQTADGVKVQVYTHHVGDRWKFYVRERRFDVWELVENPLLADWLKLLDGVERRIARRLVRPEEAQRVRKAIHELFPEAELP